MSEKLIKTYLVQGKERIKFDKSMEVSKEDLDWDIPDVLWMVIEMGPELNGLSEEEPSDKKVQYIEKGHIG